MAGQLLGINIIGYTKTSSIKAEGAVGGNRGIAIYAKKPADRVSRSEIRQGVRQAAAWYHDARAVARRSQEAGVCTNEHSFLR
jgi:hypothetical protein